jgi:hypothetical protein
LCSYERDEPALASEDVRRLLTDGKGLEPALELRIAKLRDAILEAGPPFVEVLPTPAGYSFTACLTHDIDFIGIRQHRFDHTMWGFLYRSTLGAVREFARGRMGLRKLLRVWKAARITAIGAFAPGEGLLESISMVFERGTENSRYLLPDTIQTTRRRKGKGATRSSM